MPHAALPIFARRTEAKELIQHFAEGLTNTPIFLTGAPDTGKSIFLMNDVQREGLSSGYIPIYIDMKSDGDHPAETLKQQIACGILYLRHTASLASRAYDLFRRLFTSDVEKIEVEVAALRLALKDDRDGAVRKVVHAGAEELPGLIATLAEASHDVGRPVILVIDHADLIPNPIAQSLRSALFRHWSSRTLSAIFAVGTGEALNRLLNDPEAPFGDFGDTVALKPLGERFVRAMNSMVLIPRGIEVRISDLKRVLAAFDGRPAPFTKVLEHLVRRPALGLDHAFNTVLSSERNGSSAIAHARAWSQLTPLQRVVLRDIALGRSPHDPDAIHRYNLTLPEGPGVDALALRKALESLTDQRVLKYELDRYRFRNPSLHLWARGKGPLSTTAIEDRSPASGTDATQDIPSVIEV